MTDLDSRMTQAAFGGLVGITQQAVSDLLTREVLRDGATARTWLLAYTEHLRTIAAGRDPDGEVSTERARHLRASAEKIEMANAVTRREMAPVTTLEFVLSDLARRISTRLDAVVPQIHQRLPDLPASALAQVASEIAVCREDCATINLADADKLAREGDEEDDSHEVPA